MKLNRNKIKRSRLKKYIQTIIAKNIAQNQDPIDEIMEAIIQYEETKYGPTYIKCYANSLILPENKKLHKFIIGAIKETVDRHGTITRELIGSAAKRIYMHIASYTTGDG